jgi:hypothetical protein
MKLQSNASVEREMKEGRNKKQKGEMNSEVNTTVFTTTFIKQLSYLPLSNHCQQVASWSME